MDQLLHANQTLADLVKRDAFGMFYRACLFELLQSRVSFTKCVISFPKLLVKMHFQLVTVADQLSCTNL